MHAILHITPLKPVHMRACASTYFCMCATLTGEPQSHEHCVIVIRQSSFELHIASAGSIVSEVAAGLAAPSEGAWWQAATAKVNTTAGRAVRRMPEQRGKLGDMRGGASIGRVPFL